MQSYVLRALLGFLVVALSGSAVLAGDWPWPPQGQNQGNSGQTIPGQPVPGSLTLAQAIDRAQSLSPEIHAAQAEAAASSWSRLESLADHLPHLNINASHDFTEKYMDLQVNFAGTPIVFPEANPQDMVDIGASIMVFDGFSAINRYRAAIADNEAAEFRLRRQKFQVEQMVKIRFQRALANEALLGVADENIKSLEDHFSQAQLLAKTGFSTRFDTLRVQAQLDEARAAKLVSVDDVVQARRDLARAMGVDEIPMQLVGELPVPDVHAIPAELKFDPSQRDDLQAEDRHERAIDLRSSAAMTFWVPKFEFFGDLFYYKFGAFDPAILPTDWGNGYTVGVRATWNLFDGGASYARDREAAESSRREEAMDRAAHLDAYDDLDNWKRRFLSNAVLYEARTRTVEEGQESVRLAAIGLKAGTRTSTERLDAELELFQARAGLVRAQADADEALLRLELAAGRHLATIGQEAGN